ncbi:hypothetical protein SAMN05216480_10611 [Pustulibacterium marinum]|uniref:DUF4468 domain-containing protein n=1 Tax=Pustulibacterium marinum TaxID=1224947 RepID=A0A1I7GVB7_9FLAO|nr:hypothetical protein [Pustulibacterium marinum]SFU52362.1 hypothetical protein SAMN05216480_10611 [Pustulibacterium marinum]
MKTYVVLVCILLSMFSVSAQDTLFIRKDVNWDPDIIEYQTDTLIFNAPEERRNLLIGNTILEGSENYGWRQNLHLNLKKVDYSACSNNIEMDLENRINSIQVTDTTLVVDINIVANCCSNLLYDAAVDDNGTLQLIIHEYSGYCTCACCFGLVFNFKLDKELFDPKTIKKVIIEDIENTLTDIDWKQ